MRFSAALPLAIDPRYATQPRQQPLLFILLFFYTYAQFPSPNIWSLFSKTLSGCPVTLRC